MAVSPTATNARSGPAGSHCRFISAPLGRADQHVAIGMATGAAQPHGSRKALFEPGGSSRCYWNGCGCSAATRPEDVPVCAGMNGPWKSAISAMQAASARCLQARGGSREGKKRQSACQQWCMQVTSSRQMCANTAGHGNSWTVNRSAPLHPIFQFIRHAYGPT